MLCLLVAGQRGQVIWMVDSRNMTIRRQRIACRTGEPLKISKPRNDLIGLNFDDFPPDKRLYVVHLLKVFLKRTKCLREKRTVLLTAIKSCLEKAGVLSYLSRSLADRWGTTLDFTTSFLHSSRFSAFRSMMSHSRPVHSLMLSSHLFRCLPLRLPPWTVSCRIVLASPDDRVTCPYHFSLRLFTVVKRSSYGPMAFPILAFTSSLVMWSLYEIPRSLRKHLISNACILLSMSAVMVHVSHAYKNMDMARERISLILELMAMFLSFQMTFSLVTAAVVWAVLDSTSGWDPSSDTIAPRYLKLRTVSSFLLSMVMSVLMPLVLFVISWVFFAMICIPYAVEASSRWFTNLTSSCSCPARPSMSSAKRKFVIVLPPILTVPSWSSSAAAIIPSKKMLKRVGESRHPWRTPIVEWTQQNWILCQCEQRVRANRHQLLSHWGPPWRRFGRRMCNTFCYLL